MNGNAAMVTLKNKLWIPKINSLTTTVEKYMYSCKILEKVLPKNDTNAKKVIFYN